MAKFSPKIEIINHFDDLINRVDIDIDSSLEKFNDQQLLNELLTSSKYDRSLSNSYVDLAIIYFDKFYSPKPKQNLNPWSYTTNVVEYLKEIRMKTIEQLRKAQDKTLEYYKLNSARFKSELTIDELRGQLLADNFYINKKLYSRLYFIFLI